MNAVEDTHDGRMRWKVVLYAADGSLSDTKRFYTLYLKWRDDADANANPDSGGVEAPRKCGTSRRKQVPTELSILHHAALLRTDHAQTCGSGSASSGPKIFPPTYIKPPIYSPLVNGTTVMDVDVHSRPPRGRPDRVLIFAI